MERKLKPFGVGNANWKEAIKAHQKNFEEKNIESEVNTEEKKINIQSFVIGKRHTIVDKEEDIIIRDTMGQQNTEDVIALESIMQENQQKYLKNIFVYTVAILVYSHPCPYVHPPSLCTSLFFL